jgi:hypothetical protein
MKRLVLIITAFLTALLSVGQSQQPNASKKQILNYATPITN